MTSATVVHDVQNVRRGSDRSYTETYLYDRLGRLYRVNFPTGSAVLHEYDLQGRITARRIGSATDLDKPEPNGQAPALQLAVTYEYDNNEVGNGYLTKSTAIVGDQETRSVERVYDIFGRLLYIKQSGSQSGSSVSANITITAAKYDAHDRVVATAEFTSEPALVTANGGQVFGVNMNSPGRISYTEIKYNSRGLPYERRVAINATVSGTPNEDDYLIWRSWYDISGRVIATRSPDSPMAKIEYDNLGRVRKTYLTDAYGDDTSTGSNPWDLARTVANDHVIEQTEYSYAPWGALELVTHTVRRHEHDKYAAEAQGDLLLGSTVLGVSTYAGYRYDAAGRLVETVDFGTNSISHPTHPHLANTYTHSSKPVWSSTAGSVNPAEYAAAIKTFTSYNKRGLVESVTDGMNRSTRFIYDSMDRQIAVIENAVVSVNGSYPTLGWDRDNMRWTVIDASTEADVNRVTSTALTQVDDGSTWVINQTAHNNDGTDQTTQYRLGVVKTGSTLNSHFKFNDWLAEVRYPGANGLPSASDSVKYAYNGQHEISKVIDQNGTTHTYTRDSLGRVVKDEFALGDNSAIDVRVRAISASYDSAGRLQDVRSHSHSDTQGITLNHVRYAYDDTKLGVLSSITQDNDSDIDTTPYSANNRQPRQTVYSYDVYASSATGLATKNALRLRSQQYPRSQALIESPDIDSDTVLTYMYGYASGTSPTTINNAIGRIASLSLTQARIVPNFEGDPIFTAESSTLAAYTYLGLSTPTTVSYLLGSNTMLDRTVDELGYRTPTPTYTESKQQSGAYPGFDQFGQVRRHAWVQSSYKFGDNGPSGLAHVLDEYQHDKAGNITAMRDARVSLGNSGTFRDRGGGKGWSYQYDGLNRLVEARRGILAPTTFGVTQSLLGSQKWQLDKLGNSERTAIDFSTPPSTAPSNPPTYETGEYQDREHGAFNMLNSTTKAAASASTSTVEGAPVSAQATYTHDAAGNRTGIKTATHQYTLIYDAWHRLVEIKRATLDASGNPDPATQVVVARYEYNGLHQRAVKFTDHIAATTSNPAYFKTALHFYYNAAWQAVVEEQFSKLFATGSYNKSRYIQQFFGVRGINDVLFRREQTAGWQPTEYIPDIPGTSKTTSFYNSSYYQLTDAQGSVVGLVAAQQYGVVDTVNGIANFAFGQRFDELMYDPYGRAVRPVSTDADFNGDGGVTVQDIFDFLAAWFEGSATADVNADNAVTTQDIFDYLARWFAGGQGTIDRVSHPSVNNPYGYCGYYADAETVGMLGKHNGGLYHVRHRVYDPISGRFLQRDPAGFVDGMNLYAYCAGGPIGCFDPMGLQKAQGDIINENDKAFRDRLWHVATYDNTQKGENARLALQRNYKEYAERAIGNAVSAAKTTVQAVAIITGADTVQDIVDGNYVSAGVSLALPMFGKLRKVGKLSSGLEAALAKYGYNNLADLLGKSLRHLEVLKDHAGHIKAAMRELQGEVVALKASGKAFDHVNEVREHIQGAKNTIEDIKRIMSSGNLTAEEREVLEEALSELSKSVDEAVDKLAEAEKAVDATKTGCK